MQEEENEPELHFKLNENNISPYFIAPDHYLMQK
jgi:hypothetical protein